MISEDFEWMYGVSVQLCGGPNAKLTQIDIPFRSAIHNDVALDATLPRIVCCTDIELI